MLVGNAKMSIFGILLVCMEPFQTAGSPLRLWSLGGDHGCLTVAVPTFRHHAGVVTSAARSSGTNLSGCKF